MRFLRMTTRRWIVVAVGLGLAIGVLVCIPSSPLFLVWVVGPCFAMLLALSIPLFVVAYFVSRSRSCDVPTERRPWLPIEPDPPFPSDQTRIASDCRTENRDSE